MRGKKTLAYEASGKVMTLAELEEVLTAARDDGANGNSVPKVRISFGGGIQQVRVEIQAVQDTKGAEG